LSELPWIVARTKVWREGWAAENIARQGLEFYLPRIAESYIPRGRHTKLLRMVPLFPTYIFVRRTDDWRRLLSTFGLSGVLLRGDNPDTMSDEGIKALKAREDKDGVVILPRGKALVHGDLVGSKVRIVQRGGVYHDYVGLCKGLNSKGRVQVLLDFMGRKVPHWFSIDDVEPIK
jgi:transcriptional antiterminator RfaH